MGGGGGALSTLSFYRRKFWNKAIDPVLIKENKVVIIFFTGNQTKTYQQKINATLLTVS